MVKLPLNSIKYHAMNTYPVLDYAPRHEDVWRSGSIAPCILNLGTRLRLMFSFMPRPLYPRERDPDTHWIRDFVIPRAEDKRNFVYRSS